MQRREAGKAIDRRQSSCALEASPLGSLGKASGMYYTDRRTFAMHIIYHQPVVLALNLIISSRGSRALRDRYASRIRSPAMTFRVRQSETVWQRLCSCTSSIRIEIYTTIQQHYKNLRVCCGSHGLWRSSVHGLRLAAPAFNAFVGCSASFGTRKVLRQAIFLMSEDS